MAARVVLLALIAISTVQFATAKLEYPCPLDNYECIGQILQANSGCRTNSVPGFIKQEFVIPETYFETPSVNASTIEKNLIVRNLNLCRVSAFYINTDTNKVVLGIDCPDKDNESDRIMKVHRSLREDDVYRYHIRAIYPLLRITVVFENWANMDLCSNTHFFAEVLKIPDEYITPLDKPAETMAIIAQHKAQIAVTEAELYFWRGPRMARKFIKSLLCDYPCDVENGKPINYI